MVQLVSFHLHLPLLHCESLLCDLSKRDGGSSHSSIDGFRPALTTHYEILAMVPVQSVKL